MDNLSYRVCLVDDSITLVRLFENLRNSKNRNERHWNALLTWVETIREPTWQKINDQLPAECSAITFIPNEKMQPYLKTRESGLVDQNHFQPLTDRRYFVVFSVGRSRLIIGNEYISKNLEAVELYRQQDIGKFFLEHIVAFEKHLLRLSR